ncbi:MAG TPA: molybdopterin-dependent oxidoreductase [Longimicrobiaceae bacterium]|nr:molybdopterin-dependent oxidoreductase [Longimicrobiaceae bacterium]
MMDRRRFLALGGLSAAGLLAAACDSPGPKSARKVLHWAERRNESVERFLFRHTAMDHGGGKLVGGRMPSYFISPKPPVWDDALRGMWALEVSGAVKTPLRLTLNDLAKLPRVTQRIEHFCVEGWTATTEFGGVRVSTLARLAGAHPDAGYVDFQSFDGGYHESWDLESATHPQTLVAFLREGRPLTHWYGAPARVHSPVKLGYKNTKYLTRVVFMPQRNGGYWSDKGYEWYGGT